MVLFWLHYPAQTLLGEWTGTEIVIHPFYTAAFTFALVNIFAMAEMTRVAIRDFPQQYIIAGQVCGLRNRDILLRIQLPLLFRQLLPVF